MEGKRSPRWYWQLHWQILIAMVLAIPFGLLTGTQGAEAVGWLMLGLALGTPSLSLVGAVGAVLVVGIIWSVNRRRRVAQQAEALS